jgi:hypothetical protein
VVGKDHSGDVIIATAFVENVQITPYREKPRVGTPGVRKPWPVPPEEGPGSVIRDQSKGID